MKYMLITKEENIATEWEKYQGYTIRPTASIVEYYDRIIQSYVYMNNYFMYGGTPEIRSLFQMRNKQVILADKSDVMVKAMGRLTKRKKRLADNEHFIKMDWLEQNMPHRQTEFIIGDDAINMVSCKYFSRFLENTHRMLCKNGIFVCHLLVKPDESLINKKFSDIVNEYEQGQIKSKYDLASRLNFICYDKSNYAMSWQQTISQIGKPHLDSFKPAFDFVGLFAFCNSLFYCPPQVEFERLIEKFFWIEEIFYAHEHEYCLFEPVYLLKKKG